MVRFAAGMYMVPMYCVKEPPFSLGEQVLAGENQIMMKSNWRPLKTSVPPFPFSSRQSELVGKANCTAPGVTAEPLQGCEAVPWVWGQHWFSLARSPPGRRPFPGLSLARLLVMLIVED